MKKLLLSLAFVSFTLLLNAQLVINEFMASNNSTFQDEYGEYDDWIEIYNTSDVAISLNNYYITDNYNNPTKFDISDIGTINAHAFLLIFADENGEQGDRHANFKLDRDGERIAIVKVVGSDTTFTDSLTFGPQLTDISYGRFPDGYTHFEFFSQPTPGSSNISDNLVGIAPPPQFSIPGSFYSGAQSVELSSELAGADIRYTLDGSEPNESSALYTAPLSGNATFILKAKVFAENYLPSESKGYTYFIDEHFIVFDETDRLPIVSVSCDPYYLWSAEAGILHSNNLQNDWEIAATVEMYEPDGNNVINQLAGIKLFGHSTRVLAQKSFAAIARSEYGSNIFDYKLFDTRPHEQYKSFVMRNSGNDWSLTYFRDDLCQEIGRGEMDVDAQAARPAIMYLNGEFYGIVSIKEKVNEHYLEANHNADPDNIDMLQDNQTLVYGDAEKYREFRGFMVYNNMSENILYTELERKMDIKEYLYHNMTQIYLANIDMALNSKYWREKEKYGKWRWILYDTEISFGQGDYSYTDQYGTLPSSNTLRFASVNYGGGGWPYLRPWSSEKFISILRNESFRNDFIQTFAAHLNTTYDSARVISIIDSMHNAIQNEIPYQIELYGGVEVAFNPYGYHFTTVEEWEANVEIMRHFARYRPDSMRLFIAERFELDGTYELSPTISDPTAGKIFIQGVEVPIDSAGIYFKSIPITVSVEANEGFKFIKWSGVNSPDTLLEDLTLTLSENTTLEAVFGPEDELMITEIYYNPEQGDEYEFIEIYNPKHSTTINLGNYTLSGAVNYTFPGSGYIGPMQYMVIAADESNYDMGNIQTFSWTSGNLANDTDTIVLKDDGGMILDSVTYFDTAPWPQLSGDKSIELIDNEFDNSLGSSWRGSYSTGGSPGIPAFTNAIISVVINEFLASNNNYNADEFNEYEDWIELLNTGNESVNIGGMFITNDLDIPDLYQIPTNTPKLTTIEPGEHLILWADEDTEQGALHMGFKLTADGGDIALSVDGSNDFESLHYTSQSEDDSYGRYPDGADNWVTFLKPTPNRRNSYPPEFISVPIITVERGADYEYNIVVSDAETDNVIIGLYEKPTFLYFVSTSGTTATLYGATPSSGISPATVKLFVTDGYSKPIVQEFTISNETILEMPVESYALNQMRTYPNPTEGLINIEAQTDSRIVQIEIGTITGRTIWSEQVVNTGGSFKLQIDLSGFEKGMYFINFKTDRGTLIHKIIKI